MADGKLLKYVSLAELHAFSGDNISRVGALFKDDADQKTLVAAMFPGWNEELGIIGAYKLSKEQAEEGVKERSKLHALLQAETEDVEIKVEGKTFVASANDRLAAWEAAYMKNGKVIAPTYGQVFGFRRNSILPTVNAIRRKAQLQPIESIPVSIKSYENDLERFEDTISENTLKNFGTRTLSDVDRISAAQRLFHEGATQTHLRRVFKDGMGQKLHALCTLDHAHKDLNIVKRLIAGELQFGPLDKEEMRKLVKDAATSEAVAKYVEHPKDGTNESKMASKKDVKTMADQVPVEIIAIVLKAVVEDKLPTLVAFVKKAEAINAAVKAVMEQKS
jgi:hypothetical protein